MKYSSACLKILVTAFVGCLSIFASVAQAREPKPKDDGSQWELGWRFPAAPKIDGFRPEDVLAEWLRGSTTRKLYIESLVSRIVDVDRNKNGLDISDIKILEDKSYSESGQYDSKKFWARDVNKDGFVSASEHQTPLGKGPRFNGEDIFRGLLKAYDYDSDRRISEAEFDQRINRLKRPNYRKILRQLLFLDPNNDGRLKKRELKEVANAYFRKFDRNRDDRIGPSERDRLPLGTYSRVFSDNFSQKSSQQAIADGAIFSEICPKIKLPKNAKIVVFGIYEADYLSSVYIGSENSTTEAINAVIEPGAEPLVLFLSSRSGTIWNFSGAVDRIKKVIIRSWGSGIVGLPAGVLADRDYGCLPSFSEVHSDGGVEAKARLQAQYPKKEILLGAAYSASSVTLPSFDFEHLPLNSQYYRYPVTAPEGFDEKIWNWEVLRHWRAGIANIDSSSVVTWGWKAKDYSILPSYAGLAQLVSQGKLQVIAAKGFRNRYKIIKPFPVFPANVKATFILPRGMVHPAGYIVHSGVIYED